jgi:hypothetical protein
VSLIAVLVVLVIVGLVLTILLIPFRRSTPGAPNAHDSQPATASPPETDRETAAPPPETQREPALRLPNTKGEAAVQRRGTQPELSALLDEKERVFQAIADLRFDFEAGKLSREDFEEEDARLRERAADLLRELDRSN